MAFSKSLDSRDNYLRKGGLQGIWRSFSIDSLLLPLSFINVCGDYVSPVHELIYWTAHPCNTREFKIYIGETDRDMVEVIHDTLRNDNTPETFTIRSMNNAGLAFPTRFIKIVPLSYVAPYPAEFLLMFFFAVSAHGPNFHTSIWYVKLTGIMNERYVENVRSSYEQVRVWYDHQFLIPT